MFILFCVYFKCTSASTIYLSICSGFCLLGFFFFFFFTELIHNLLSHQISISDAYSLMKCSKVFISVPRSINWLAILLIPTELLKPGKTIFSMTWIINLLGLQCIPYPGLVIFHYPINLKMTWSRIFKYFYSDPLGILKQVLGK